MRNMTMEQEVASKTLTKSGPTLGLKIKCFSRPNNFHVNPVGRGANYRIFDRPVISSLSQVCKLRLTLRRPGPTNGTTMWMMRVKHFTTTMDQTELRRVTQIRTGNGRRSIRKCIRTVGQRFVLIMKMLLLLSQVVYTERLRAEVHSTG